MAAPALKGKHDPVAVLAAEILVSLRYRKVRERPEWLPRKSGEASSSGTAAAAAAEVSEGRPRKRGARRRSLNPWLRALRELRSGVDAAAAAAAVSGAWSSGEEMAPSPPRPHARHAGGGEATASVAVAAPYYGAPAGSGCSPSTSAHARGQPSGRPRHAGEVAAKAAVAAPPKQPMAAPSPETPLDFESGGSGASSSADDAARPQAKRKGHAALGSGGASSGDDDEGCSSPAKRTRVGGGGGEAAGDEPISAEPAAQSEPSANGRKFVIDLNIPWTEDDCSEMC